MNDERIKRDFKSIDSVLNNMGFDEQEVAKKLADNHPTLQQAFMRLIAEFIHKEAQKQCFDERNKATVQACKKLSKLIKDENIYFPTI